MFGAHFPVSNGNNNVTYNLCILLLMTSKVNKLPLKMEPVAYDNNIVLYERYYHLLIKLFPHLTQLIIVVCNS